MNVQQAFRYELAPTRRQGNLLTRAAGTARYAYNWGLDVCRALLGKHQKISSAEELHKMWNVYKRENAPWSAEVSTCAPQEALRDLRRAFDNFFASRQGKRAGPKIASLAFARRGGTTGFV